jgi:MFS family permease
MALSLLPQTWKFLWAPIADTTLSRRTWYMMAVAVTALGIVAMSALPADARGLPLLSLVVVVTSLATTFLGMAVEGLMAYGTADDARGRAGGWFQAGNLGGGGLGGGAGLWLAQALPAPWMAGAIVALVCVLCAVALRYVPEPPRFASAHHYGATLAEVGRDLWRVARSRAGMLGLLICFLPIGTGAAGNLWAATANDWHATADTVALVTGALGGLVSAAGCLAGGYWADRLDRKNAYALYGLLMVLCAGAMALVPRTEGNYVVFTLVYAFIAGLTYAGFSAVVLESIGAGAAATKYSLFASLSNMPIAYMTLVAGWSHERWGTTGMLQTEAVIGMAGIVVFYATAAALRHRQVPATSR